MKKGCFIKGVIILTVVVAAIVYIVNNKLDDYIIKPGKKIITDLMINEFNENMQYVKNTAEKDSTVVLVNAYLKDLSNKGTFTKEKAEIFLDSIFIFFEDSVIEQSEFIRIKNLINSNKLK